MQNNVFLRLAQERYTTKHYNGQQIPREEFDTLLEILRLTPTSVNAQALQSDGRFPNAEVKNAQDQGRRYFAGLHQGSEAELVAWEARQAYIGMGFLLFAAAGMGIDSTALEGVDFPKLNEILGLDEKNLTAIAAVSLGYRSPKDGNAQRPKSRLTRDELFTSLD